MDETQISNEYFQVHILSLLEKIFGITKSSFWLADELGNVYSPASTEGNRIVSEYLDENLSQVHGLNPQNVGISYAVGKRVLYNNFSTMAVIHEQKDYHAFMCRHGYFREAAVYLSHRNKLIGCLGIGRAKHEKAFHPKEIAILSNLSKYISQGLYNNQLFYSKEYEKKIFEMFSEKSTTGFIICDAKMKVHYANKSSFEICNELLDHRSTKHAVELFLNTILAESHLLWKMGYESTFFTSSLKQVKITVIPTASKYNIVNGKEFYIVTLSYVDQESRNNIENMKQKQLKPLTIRERQILSLVIQGKSNQEIADELYISIHTVKKYVQILFRKFGAKNRTSLIFAVSMVIN